MTIELQDSRAKTLARWRQWLVRGVILLLLGVLLVVWEEEFRRIRGIPPLDPSWSVLPAQYGWPEQLIDALGTPALLVRGLVLWLVPQGEKLIGEWAVIPLAWLEAWPLVLLAWRPWQSLSRRLRWGIIAYGCVCVALFYLGFVAAEVPEVVFVSEIVGGE